MTTNNNIAEDVPPDAGALAESLRDFGYTLPTAIADLIDNSLTAGAKHIEIQIQHGQDSPYIALIDDGSGMSEKTLVEAMRMGSGGPKAQRSEKDLGRFGLGLKTASLSQGRCVTVITRTEADPKPSVRCWDIDHIAQSGKWQLLNQSTQIADQYLERISNKPGTAVIIEKLDRPAFVNAQPLRAHEVWTTVSISVRQHISMVFHRFISDGVVIQLGSTAIDAWDPFIEKLSTRRPPENLSLRGESITVTPFILPHHSKLTNDAHDRASGPNGWNAHQGFYIYRCRRLIVAGAWLNLPFKKDEHLKLARIMVDIPNGMDADWNLNVMKSHVAVPAPLRDDFVRIAEDVRRQAGNVYRFRGEAVAPTNAPPEKFLWRRTNVSRGVRYQIDKTHPVVRALLHAGGEHENILKKLLELIEETLPIASIRQENARAIDGAVTVDEECIADQVELAAFSIKFYVATGKSPREARELVLSSQPMSPHREKISELLDRKI